MTQAVEARVEEGMAALTVGAAAFVGVQRGPLEGSTVVVASVVVAREEAVVVAMAAEVMEAATVGVTAAVAARAAVVKVARPVVTEVDGRSRTRGICSACSSTRDCESTSLDTLRNCSRGRTRSNRAPGVASVVAPAEAGEEAGAWGWWAAMQAVVAGASVDD